MAPLLAVVSTSIFPSNAPVAIVPTAPMPGFVPIHLATLFVCDAPRTPVLSKPFRKIDLTARARAMLDGG